MNDAFLQAIRLLEDVFPGSLVLVDGVWRRVQPATPEERRRWGWQ